MGARPLETWKGTGNERKKTGSKCTAFGQLSLIYFLRVRATSETLSKK